MITEEEGDKRRFQVGEVYIATPALKGQPKKLGAVLNKDGGTLLVAFVDELAIGSVKVFEGRDFATLETRIGQYNLYACAKAAAKDAAIVNDILKAQSERNSAVDA